MTKNVTNASDDGAPNRRFEDAVSGPSSKDTLAIAACQKEDCVGILNPGLNTQVEEKVDRGETFVQEKRKGVLARAYNGFLRAFTRDKSRQPETGADGTYVDVREARALLRYSIERAREERSDDVNLCQELADALDGVQSSDSNSTDPSPYNRLASAYGNLARHTYLTEKVNGRTIIDSSDSADYYIAQAGFVAVLALFLGLSTELLAFWLEQGTTLLEIVELSRRISPLYWGALGSSVYLMKTLSDAAGRCQFDSRRVEGVVARILLGAIVAFVAVKHFNLSDAIQGGGAVLQFSEAGVAFVAGLGVRVVYNVFMTVLDGVDAVFKGRVKGPAS